MDHQLELTKANRLKMVGAAYSSLVCSQGIEVSVYVEERHRQRGVATALCSRLLLDCLALGRGIHDSIS